MDTEPGIFVALDRFGEHFAYARHPDSHVCKGKAAEQTQKIENMHMQASDRGGKVVLLSLDEFDALILNKTTDHAALSTKDGLAA
jgi:hypothetical protein